MGKTTRENQAIKITQLVLCVKDKTSTGPQLFHRSHRIVFAVCSREDDDTNRGCH
jgi:hypothetical protein